MLDHVEHGFAALGPAAGSVLFGGAALADVETDKFDFAGRERVGDCAGPGRART